MRKPPEWEFAEFCDGSRTLIICKREDRDEWVPFAEVTFDESDRLPDADLIALLNKIGYDPETGESHV